MDITIGVVTGYICFIISFMCIVNLQKFRRMNPIPLELQRRYMHDDDSDGLHSSDADDEGDVPNI